MTRGITRTKDAKRSSDAPARTVRRRAAQALRAATTAVALLTAAVAPSFVAAQTPLPADAALDYKLQAHELAAGVYVVEGANADFSPANGCNIINTGFIATGAGVVVVNTGPSRRYGEQLRALIARTVPQPVVRVVHLNLHPDYFLGNQAFADVPRVATPRTRAGMQREAKAYEDNLYRLCGEWMKGTEALLPSADLAPGTETIGSHTLEYRELSGHTDSDLVLTDRTSGVVFAGGLVFVQRIPTTPHAELVAWRKSLDALSAESPRALVPSHGPVRGGATGIARTKAYLDWLDATLRSAAESGLEINELLRAPVPAEFRAWAAFDTEFARNVAHLYPRYEQRVLQRSGR